MVKLDSCIISVIMAVYNTEEQFLREAVESILRQTLQEFEFIIIDDASEDYVSQVLHSYQDNRIRYFRNEKNEGLTKSLNKALRMAKGKYVARMDSDDIALEQRLELQYRYMERNKDIFVLGALATRTSDHSIIGYFPDSKKEEIQARLLFDNIELIHPTAFFRMDTLQKNQLHYDETIKKAQDYGMWVACSRYGRIACLCQVVLNYRVHASQISVEGRENQAFFNSYIRLKQLEEMGLKLDERQKEIFLDIREYKTGTSVEELYRLLMQIKRQNSKTGYFNKQAIEKEMLMRWLIIVRKTDFKKVFCYAWSYKILFPANLWYIIKQKKMGIYR